MQATQFVDQFWAVKVRKKSFIVFQWTYSNHCISILNSDVIQGLPIVPVNELTHKDQN